MDMKRWGTWLHWNRTQRELQEEMATHRALKRDELEAGGLRGARLEAAVERSMGSDLLAAEDARSVWLWSWITAAGTSLRQAARGLRRAPAFTLVAVATLALGIGANTAIFSVIEAVLLRPLPYPAPDRIAAFTLDIQGTPQADLSVPGIEFVRDNTRSFSAVAGYRGAGIREMDHAGKTDWAHGVAAMDGFFQVLGTAPRLGRGFQRSDTAAGAPEVIVLSDAFWRSAFQASPTALGQVVQLDGGAATIVGVLPPGFQFAENPADFFSCLQTRHSLGNDGWNTAAIARLRPGVSLAAARAEVAALARPLQARRLAPIAGRGVGVDSYQAVATSSTSTSLWLLFGAVALLLLIACVNVAGLVMARALARGRETALRRALGASRGRLLLQFLAEGIVLAAAGAAAGLGLAFWLLGALARQLPAALGLTAPDHPDGAVLAFTSGVTIAVALGFGLVSLAQTRRTSLMPGAYGAPRGREWMVGVEIALALLLLAGAGVLVRSLAWLQSQPLGFQAEGTLFFHTDFAAAAIHSAPQALQLNQEILARLEAVPGVQSVALTTLAPLRGQANVPMEPADRPDQGRSVELRAVSPDFFRSLHIPLQAGRGIEMGDTASSPHVVVVNAALARAWYGGQALSARLRIGAIGSRVYMPGFDDARQVVGVAGDIRAVRLDRPARPTVYVPYTQLPSASWDWIVRGSGTGLPEQLRSAVHDLSPSTRITGLRPYPELLGAVVAQPLFLARLLSLLAGFALLLTAVGLYGVLAYAVAQRTQEIGIRIALGADAARLRRAVVGRGLLLAALGMLAGYLAVVPLASLLQGLLYGVKPLDPASLAGAGVLLLLIALAASWIPARRATRVDPVRALRAE